MENGSLSLFKWVVSAVKTDAFTAASAGIAGAIAISFTEWKGLIMLGRQVVVGGICAVYASDITIPILSYVMGIVSLDQDASSTLAPFLTGVLAISIFEYILATFRSRTKYLKDNPQPPTPPKDSPHGPHGGGSDRGDLGDGLD